MTPAASLAEIAGLQIERTLEKGVQRQVLAVKLQLAETVQLARDEGMPDAADILERRQYA